MVYAISMPLSGRFSPQAECPEWENSIENYFNNNLPVEEKAKFRRFNSFLLHVKLRFNGRTGFITKDFQMQKWNLTSNIKSLGDLIQLPFGMAVSEPLRNAIEALDVASHKVVQRDDGRSAADG